MTDVISASGKMLCLVESNAAAEAARARYGASCAWLTTSPAVYERMLAANDDVRFLDGDVAQSAADAIGYLACDLTLWLSEHIDRSIAASGATTLRPGRAMCGALQRTLVRFLYKGYLLDHALAKGASRENLLVVGDPVLEPMTSFALRSHRFETLFTPIAGRIGIPVLAFKTPLPNLPATGDVHVPTSADRFLTVMNAELSALAFKMWSTILRRRPLRFGKGGNRPLILIDGANELIEEIFATLLWRGYDIARLPAVDAPVTPTPWTDVVAQPEVDRVLAKAAGANNLLAGEATRAALGLALERIYDSLAWAPAAAAKAEAVAAKVARDAAGQPVAVLSATMHTGYPLLLMQALNAAHIRTFKAEHGSAPGQSPLQTASARVASAEQFMDTLYYTGAQLHEAKHLFGEATPCTVVGAPRCVKKPRFYGLQRAFMRRRLGIRGRHLVWCTGLYPNNEQFLPHYWIDGPYHLARKSTIEDALGGLPDRVTIKLHPAARYVDGDPLFGGMKLPGNCVTIPDQDFRYLRATADVVIVDGPGSVLSWAMGLRVPIIFIEFGMYCLNEAAEAAFRSGMLYVDARKDGWQRELRGLLQLPHSALVARYAALEAARPQLLEEYVFGPEGSSARRSVDYIAQRLVANAA
jgi:hypothetical protein